MVLPFGVLLGLIAIGPMVFPSWWSRHYPKAACGLAAITLVWYFIATPDATARVWHTAHEYVSFIALIGALFVVSGGIHITVKGEATPFVNTVFLLIGGIIANVLGTTGASMLLIRPWLRMNKYRVTGHHVVFFIFIVSNVGGCLTPIGDPPLFLGYLRGIPFWWVARNCLPMWGVGMGMLLLMFFVVDRRNYLHAPRAVRAELAERPEQWRVEGLGNLFFLAVILRAVFINRPTFLREGLMLAAGLGSWFTTRKSIHEANHFHFHPINEVAVLFAGIFATMMPALDWLELNAGRLANPGAPFFYWSSGGLSSVLDNAPTYLCFLKAIIARFGVGDPAIASLLEDSRHGGYILAISVAAVFFGANTYIGNGPNFMVKAIADYQKVHTPGFLGYVFRYTLPFMMPMLLVVWWLFFRD